MPPVDPFEVREDSKSFRDRIIAFEPDQLGGVLQVVPEPGLRHGMITTMLIFKITR